MEKIANSKVVDEIFNRAISEKLLNHTCQIFKPVYHGFNPYGSGVFVKVHDAHFIFTASHVVKIIDGLNNLYINLSDDEFVNVCGTIKRTNTTKKEAVDLAYIRLDENIVPNLLKKYSFVTIDKIRKHSNLLEGGANYCVLGYPENNVNDDLTTTAQAYFTLPTNDKPYDYYNLDKDKWIILKMTGKCQDVVSKKKSEMNTHLYGLSGCGLWLLMPNTRQNTYDYRLIGIMTDFKKGKFYCLIGNKIHLLIEALSTFEGMKFQTKTIK